MSTLCDLVFLGGAVCFILALNGLASARTARKGNLWGMAGMGMTLVVTLLMPGIQRYGWILLGIAAGGACGTWIARSIVMTALPQLVAAFHSLVGLAAVCVAWAVLDSPGSFESAAAGFSLSTGRLLEMGLGVAVGAFTFTGSVAGFLKLQGLVPSKPLAFRGQHPLNALLAGLVVVMVIIFAFTASPTAFLVLTLLALVLGALLVLPIGGADMPVVISMLNSYSGWAAAGIGLTLSHTVLLVTGALVGASGAILSYVMCKGMNRSIISVILGGFGTGQGSGESGTTGDQEQRPVRAGSADDAAFLMKNARSMIVVPGYGMAVAQAQHSLREMADLLKKEGVRVRYAIHPVAGRMPGHMNVLLAEASVPYDDVVEMDDINPEFSQTDVVYVIGANDVTNPAAKTDPASPIYGMPVLDVDKARTVIFVKRSMAAGYAGVDNSLFYSGHTMMLFGDAKKVTEQIVKSLAIS